MNDSRNQLVMDFSPASRRTHPDTSLQAEKKITESGGRLTHCQLILHTLRRKNGATTKELADILEGRLTHAQIWRRMNDLVEHGYIQRNDKIRREGNSTWWIR